MRAGWGSLEDTSSLRYWAVAFLGVASALHQHRACFYFKSQGVPVWWLVQDKLYCLCFVAVNKHYKLVGVVQMPRVCSVCCSLLEMMLESSLSDLRDSQGVSLHHVPSLLRLLRLLQDFLFAEGTDNHTLWSEKVRNGLICSYTHRLLFQSQKSLKEYVHNTHKSNLALNLLGKIIEFGNRSLRLLMHITKKKSDFKISKHRMSL